MVVSSLGQEYPHTEALDTSKHKNENGPMIREYAANTGDLLMPGGLCGHNAEKSTWRCLSARETALRQGWAGVIKKSDDGSE